MTEIGTSELLSHLQNCGVVVHHVALAQPVADNRTAVVFLEGALDQGEHAQNCAESMPGVLEVSFASHSRAIMYVRFLSSSG